MGERRAAALPLAELTAVVALVGVDLWLPADRVGTRAVVRTLVAAVMLASFYRRRRGLLAAPRTPPRRAWLEAAAGTLILAAAVLAWSAAVRGPFDELDLSLVAGGLPVLGPWLARRLALVAVQQLGLQLFFFPLVREVLRSGTLAALAVAVLFGVLHLPSVALAVATAVGAALWLGLYRRSKRLLPVILSHVVLVGVASVLPGRLFHEMKIGAAALPVAAKHRSLAGEERRALLAAVTSPRYAEFRGGTDRGYVEGLYRDVLGRVPTAAEVARGVEQLATISHLELAKRLLLAPELDAAALRGRVVDDEPLAPGIDVGPGGGGAAEFLGWYDAEPGWRWARDAAPAIRFRIDREAGRDYVLALNGGAATPVSVELELNGRVLGRSRFDAFDPLDVRFLLATEHLAADGGNELRFLVSGEPVVFEGDGRALAFGLRALRVAPLRFPSAAVLFDEDDYFLDGFSVAEERLRWTRDVRARMAYPLREVPGDGCYALRLVAGAYERQRSDLWVNGRPIAEWTLDGLTPQTRSVRFGAGLLRPGPNTLELHLPGAKSPEGDGRRLGLALVSVAIYPLADCP